MFDQLRAHIDRRINLTNDEFERFTSMLEVKYLRKKETLVIAGDVCRYEAYINKGCMKSYYTDHKLHEHVIQIGFEDWWIADMKSFFTSQPADFTVEAIEDSELFVMDHHTHDKLMEEIPAFERFFRLLVQGGYVSLQQRIVDHMSQSAEERYLTLVKKYPQMEMRVTQHTIASYLGITPEALSRIKKSIIERQRSASAS